MSSKPWAVHGQQDKTEIGGFTVVGPVNQAHPCVAYVAYLEDAYLVAAAPQLLEALRPFAAIARSALQIEEGGVEIGEWTKRMRKALGAVSLDDYQRVLHAIAMAEVERKDQKVSTYPIEGT